MQWGSLRSRGRARHQASAMVWGNCTNSIHVWGVLVRCSGSTLFLAMSLLAAQCGWHGSWTGQTGFPVLLASQTSCGTLLHLASCAVQPLFPFHTAYGATHAFNACCLLGALHSPRGVLQYMPACYPALLMQHSLVLTAHVTVAALHPLQGVLQHMPACYPGLLMRSELRYLHNTCDSPNRYLGSLRTLARTHRISRRTSCMSRPKH